MPSNLGYVDVMLIGPEIEEIFGLLLEAGISLSKHNLHCTLMYDKRWLREPLAELRPEEVFEANVTSLEVLGTGLVFHLTSKQLADEHRRLVEAGYEHSFGSFLPHMSITYDFSSYDVLKCKQLFANWGGRKLLFSREGFGTK